MLSNVAVVIMDSFTPFELGVVCEVFGVDRRDDGLPPYDFAVVAGEPGPIRSANGFEVRTQLSLVQHGLLHVMGEARSKTSLRHATPPRVAFLILKTVALFFIISRG